jgi:hypothetical protein
MASTLHATFRNSLAAILPIASDQIPWKEGSSGMIFETIFSSDF